MKSIVRLGIAVFALALPVLSANATIISFSATLSGSNETVPTGSPGTGTALVTVDDVLNTLLVDLSFASLTGPAAAGHIHCCAPAGSNAAVKIPLMGLPAAASGTYNNTFDLSAMFPSPPFTAADFIAQLLAGNAYVNLHTRSFPGGEIRGQLTRVPEPATSALFGFGLLALVFARRACSRT